MQEYVPPGIEAGVNIVPPAIDPLAEEHGAVARRRSVRVRAVRDRPRPAAAAPGVPLRSLEGPDRGDRRLQDRDPRGAGRATQARRVDGHRRPRGGGSSFHATYRYADGDPDIKILNNLNNVGAIEVNAFQSQADVVVQKSIREWDRVTVTEALWKGRPTVASWSAGSRFRSTTGRAAIPVTSSEEAARRCIEVLSDPEPSRRGQRAGKQRVREHFLTPRLLRDWLLLPTASMAGSVPPERSRSPDRWCRCAEVNAVKTSSQRFNRNRPVRR